MKKKHIITLTVTVSVIALITAFPLIFKDDIVAKIQSEIAKKIDAKIHCDDIDISILHEFPDITVSLDHVVVINKGVFKGDTLGTIDKLEGTFSLMSVIKGEKYELKTIDIDEPDVRLMVNENGLANWNIIKKDKDPKEDNNKPFRLSLEELDIKNGRLRYNDARSQLTIDIKGLDHQLKGNFGEEMNDFETSNRWEDTYLSTGDIVWLNHYTTEINADFKADITNNRYTAKNAFVKINDTELSLDGWISKTKGHGIYDMDVTVNAKDTRFKDILSLIPAVYSKRFDEIKTGGYVSIKGYAKGRMDTEGTKTKWPSFGFDINITKGWFKYPSLPKGVEDINLKAGITNPGGNIDNTIISIEDARLKIAGNPITGQLRITHPKTDPSIKAKLNGRLDMADLKSVMPLSDVETLTGSADINLTIDGLLSYYKKKQYDRFKADGQLRLNDFRLESKLLPHPLDVKAATLKFTPQTIIVEHLNIKTGSSDLKATGQIDNVIAYLMRGDTISGRLETTSDKLKIEDLLTSADKAAEASHIHLTQKERKQNTQNIVVMPHNLNLRLHSAFRQITYDKIKINNAEGNFRAREGKLEMNGVRLETMGGTCSVNGTYDTEKPAKPELSGDIRISSVLYSEVFRQVNSAKTLVPIFGKTKGRFNGKATFSTPIKSGMKPDLHKLTAKGEITSNNITISGVKALHKLSKVLNRSELHDPEIKSVRIPFAVSNGKVHTDDFSFMIADTKIQIDEGYTGIDETIDYRLHADIPASETTIFKVSKMGIHLFGTFNKPEVKIETKDMMKEAGKTISNNVKTTLNAAKEEMKTEWKAEKEDMKEEWKESGKELKSELKEAGSEIKNAFKNLFKGRD